MKELLTISLMLAVFLLQGQNDTIIFEFDSYNGEKFIHGDKAGVLKGKFYCDQLPNLPTVNYDTLRALNGNSPFTGVLITNYRWISNSQPSIFKQNIDLYNKDHCYNHFENHFRWPVVTKSIGSSDTIFANFEYIKGSCCKFTDSGKSDYYDFQLPKIDIDTLSIDGQNSYNGTLVTNYVWVTEDSLKTYNSSFPNVNRNDNTIFKTIIDSIVDGISLSQKLFSLAPNKQIFTEGYKSDAFSVKNIFYKNGNLYCKEISKQIDSNTVYSEYFSFSNDSNKTLQVHCFYKNQKYDSLYTIRKDSLTVKLKYKDGNLIDVLNTKAIYLNEKGKITSKEIFFDKIVRKSTWIIIRGEWKGESYRYLVFLSNHYRYFYDKKKLIKWGVKNLK